MRFAAELEQRGGTHLISEVSSHALALGRVYGFHFHTAVFTNLTRDHLDFHGTMEEYAAAKRLLFAPREGPAPEWAVLNRRRSVDSGPLFHWAAAHTVLYGMSPRSGSSAPKTFAPASMGLRFDLC